MCHRRYVIACQKSLHKEKEMSNGAAQGDSGLVEEVTIALCWYVVIRILPLKYWKSISDA